MKKRSLFLIISACLLFACKSEGCLPGSEKAHLVVRYGGDPVYDGCDWYLETTDGPLKPLIFPDSLKIDSLAIFAVYSPTGNRVPCGRNQYGSVEIDLQSVVIE